MNAPAAIPSEQLPSLIDRASSALSDARTSGEVLEARDLAKVAYDAAKSAGRMAKAKDAHDEVLAAVYRAQADALLIEARAKMRLADEYDAAQESGEVRTQRDNQLVENDNKLSPQDLGIRRDEIHEARQIRNAERDGPGTTERAVENMVESGREPTRAEFRRSVVAAVDDAKRRPAKEKNPIHKADPANDAVLAFIRNASEIADCDWQAIAEWRERDLTRDRMVDAARRAHGVLSKIIERTEADDA